MVRRLLSILFVVPIVCACTSPKDLTRQGYKAYEADQCAKAESRWREALDEKPFWKAWRGLALCAHRNGSHDEALDHLEKASAAAPQSHRSALQEQRLSILMDQAQTFEDAGRLEAAVDRYTEVVETASGRRREQAREHRGRIYFEQSARLMPPESEAELVRVHDLLDAAAEDVPSLQPEISLRRARLHASLSDYDAAIRAAVKARRNPSTKHEAGFALARYHAIRGDVDDALHYLTSLYDAPGDAYDRYRRRARAGMENGQPVADRDFYDLRNHPVFRQWLNGVRRVRLTVKRASDLPDCSMHSDLENGTCDPYVLVTQAGDTVFTSKKLVDERNPTWNDETVFDYEIGDPVRFLVFDSNEVVGSNAFRDDDRIGIVRAGVAGAPEEGTFTRTLSERFGESATLTFEIAFAPRADGGDGGDVEEAEDLIAGPPSDTYVYYRLAACLAEPVANLVLSSRPVISATVSLIMEYLDSQADGSFDSMDVAAEITINQVAHQIGERVSKPVDAAVSVFQAAKCTYDLLRKQ